MIYVYSGHAVSVSKIEFLKVKLNTAFVVQTSKNSVIVSRADITLVPTSS